MDSKDLELQDITGVSAIEKRQIVNVQPIDNTPFSIVTIEEGSFVALGKYRLTDYMSPDECLEKAKVDNWEFLLSVMQVFLELNKNQ